MRWTQTFIPTVKEVPQDAEVVSHRLMIRAALIRKLASGTYTYLPLGYRSLRKAGGIVREEMDAAGAIEIHMPVLQPIELWEKTGRDKDYGENLMVLTDRHGRRNALGPTHEEVITQLAADHISSYRQLPINLYQIQTKFRDEFRPRFGVLRSREFLMKDAYSFDADAASLEASYRKMYDAYCRIFDRCGLRYVAVQAESGPIGGDASHEFMVPTDAGEDVVAHTEDGSYAANIERAEVDPVPMSEEAKGARSQAAPMEEVHTPNVGSIEAVCKFLGTNPQEMIKTLLFWEPTDKDVRKLRDEYLATHKDGSRIRFRRADAHASGSYSFHVVLVRGDHDVNVAKLQKVLSLPVGLVEHPDLVEMVTHAKVGFAGPMRLLDEVDVESMVVDHAVAAMGVGVTGANKTDYHVNNVVPGRDFPLTGPDVRVADIRNAVEGDTHGGKPLRFSRGIEVGHVFKLGDKYSRSLGATFLDETGRSHPCLMGCYGIGVNRILAAAIESYHDAKGIIWPISIAPYEVLVLPLGAERDEAVRQTSEKLYAELRAGGVDVLIDDRDARPGVKFNDADLIGIPIRVVVGEKALAGDNVEVKLRREGEARPAPVADAAKQVKAAVKKLYAEL